MSYIRTKDTVYKVLKEAKLILGDNKDMPLEREKEVYYITNNTYIFKDKVIKISNNLKDVCDEYVLWQEDYNNSMPFVSSIGDNFNALVSVITLAQNAGIKCWMKLAIWTPLGLVYVAELENGDFVLL